MRKIYLIGILIINALSASAQVGTDFWFAPPNVTQYHNAPGGEPIYLLVTALDQPATVTISIPANVGFVPITLNLLAFESQRVTLTAFKAQLETQPTNTILNTGLRIQATNPITTYYEVSNTNNNEIFALKGANALGTEFYIPMHKDPNFYNHRFTNVPNDYAIASFDIIASENNTLVSIYSPVAVDGHPANTQFSITLNAGQTYSCGSTALLPAQVAPMVDAYQNPNNHPAGAVVVANKPVAVTVKDDSDHDVPAGGCYDLIGDQIVPVDIVGTDYIAVKGSLANNGRESVILTATMNNTKVYLNGSGTAIATLFAGETFQVIIDSLATSTNNAIYINTSKPVYATHITGFGCELGSAILPPLNCAGSSSISFVRSSTESFFITLLVKTSAVGDFTITGPGTATINPASFKVVPGTGGLWSAANISYNTTQIPQNQTFTITNSSELFAMGLINGGGATGCRYGYFSEFVADIVVDAGLPQTICATQSATLSGSVTGGATTGIWTTSGDGTFDDATSMTAVYTPGFNDKTTGTVTLTLTSTSVCYPQSDIVVLTITPAPTANAGVDITVCANNAVALLNGTVTIASGGIWSGGAGVFNPNNTTLNATYTPTAAEILAGTLTLTLTSTGNGSCAAATDNVLLTFSAAPTANAGTDQTVCANNPNVTLNGAVTIATGGTWTGGTGSFNPGANALNNIYTPSPGEISSGSVVLTLTTTGNGTCNAVSDNMVINITAAPTANAGLDQTKCENNAVTTLAGGVTTATGGVWSGGTGLFTPNNTTLNAAYTPSATEITNGNVTLTLTTTGNGTCSAVSDPMTITFSSAPTVNAGPNQVKCSNNSVTTLAGSVVGATGGTWSGGAGTYAPNANTLNANYTPTAAERTAGFVNLTLTSTGNGLCNPVTDQMTITFTTSPTANAGVDRTVCGNNPNVTLNGVVTIATGGTWSGGSGTFNPNPNTLNAVYTPTPAEVSAGFVLLTLTTTGNGTCNAVSDVMRINYTASPTANAGVDQTKCKNNSTATLAGSVTVATGGVWSGGTGVFTPNNTTLTATYTPSAAELAAGFVTLTLTTTGNGTCTAVTDQMTITYTASPTANAGIDQTKCGNNAATGLNGSVAGATGGTWSGGAGTFAPNANTLNATYTPTAAEVTAGTVTLILTTTGNGTCNAETDDMTITLTPSPTVNAGVNRTVCANNSNVLLNGSVSVATGGIWSGGTGAFAPGNTALNATYTPSASEISTGSVTLTLTTTGNGTCNAVSDNMLITITPAPTANAGTDQTKCANNNTATLAGAITVATGGSWSGGLGIFNPNNTTLNATYTPTAGEIATGFVNLTLTTTGNGLCSPVTDNMVITYTAAPTVDAGINQTVCANNPNVTLAGIVNGATGGQWSGGTGTYSPGNTTLNAVYTPSASEILAGTVTLTLTTTGNGTCNAVTDQMTITITPAPVVNAGTDQSSCVNNPTVNITGTVSNATGGIWSGGAGAFNPGNTALGITYTASAGEVANGFVVLTLTSTGNGNCLAVSDNMTITFTAAPTANAGSDLIACSNNAVVTLGGAVTGASGGQWTGGLGLYTPNASTLNATYTPTATEILAGSVTLTLTTTGNGTCNAVTDQMTINFTAAPTANAGSDATVCANNQTVTLNGSVSVATGGTWSGGSGTFSPNPNTLGATYTPSPAEITTGLVTLTLTTTGNGTCLSVQDQMQITITPAPVANAGSNFSACFNNPAVLLGGSIINAGGGVWSGGTGVYNPSNTTLNATYTPSAAELTAGTVTLTLTSTGNGSCFAVSDNMIINITAAPTVNAGTDFTRCANNPNVNLNGSVTGATGGQWTGGLGTFSPNNNSLNATYIPTAGEIASGVLTLTLTSTGNGTCNPVTDNMTITFTAAPTVNAGVDLLVCANNANINLNGSFSGSGGAIWSGGAGSFNPGSTTMNAVYTPTAAEISSGLIILTLTSTGNGTCLAVTDQVNVFIDPAPTANAGLDITACANNSTVTLNGNIMNAGGGAWSGGTGVYNPSNIVMNAGYTPSAAEIAAGEVTLTLTTTGNGNCNAVSDQVKITFNPAPIVQAGSDQTVCGNNNIVTLNGFINHAGGGQWSNGLGLYTPNNSILNATYSPTLTDLAAGYVDLILTSTGNGSCLAVKDTMRITYTPAPTSNAGTDISVCSNNPNITLNGVVTIATGGQWSGGTGIFNPNQNTLSAVYTPTAAEITSGGIDLTLTTVGNGQCNSVADLVHITFTSSPSVFAGPNAIVCVDDMDVDLTGFIGGPTTTGIWSTTGTGTFIPANTFLNATYQPSAADSTAGGVSLVLTSTGNGLCLPVTDTLEIDILPAGIASAGSDVTVCANNSTVFLTGSVGGGASTGTWSTSGNGVFVPNATTMTAAYIPSANDTATGSVTLTLTANSCNMATDQMVITITPAPQVNAGIDQTVCVDDLDINLNGSVSGATTTGYWTSSGTGTFVPNDQTMNAVYQASALDSTNLGVTLVLHPTGIGSCIMVTDTLEIDILPPGIVSAGSDQILCANNGNVQLNGSITGGASQGIWATSGSGSFVPNNTSLNAIYSPSAADTSTGSVTLALTATDACNFAMDILQINFTPAPTAYAGLDQSVCANNSLVSLNGNITVALGGLWTTSGTGTFSPNNTTLAASYQPSPNDIANGQVNLILTTTGNGGCIAVNDTMTITITPSPVVNAGVNQQVCATGGNTNLYGIITGGATAGTWTTLGDGSFNPSPNQLSTEYVFGNADTTNGSVQLILTTTDHGSCLSVSDTMQIIFGSSVFVDAGPDKATCITNPNVTMNAIVTGGSTTGLWSTSGTGTFIPNSTSLNPTYQLSPLDSINGFVYLYLASTFNGGCQAGHDTVYVTIQQLPAADAGVDQNVCLGTNDISLNGTILNASGGIWTTSGTGIFDPDNTTLSAVYHPSASDSINGHISIFLSTTGNAICPADADTMEIFLSVPLNPSFAHNIPCLNQTVQFTDNTTISTGTITNWLWTFDGSATDMNQNPDYTFNTTGNHTVSLVVTSSLGCSYSTQQTIYVNPLPTADFTFVSPCYLDAVQFTDQSTAPTGNINNWSWNFGDTTFSILQNPSHLYDTATTFNVTLTVTSDSGCVASHVEPVLVYPAPNAGFTYAYNCIDLGVAFTDTSVANGVPITQWNWNFGDANTGTGQTVSNTYALAGTYDVQLIASASANCTDTATISIPVTTVVSGFSYFTNCINNEIQFTDTSIADGTSISDWAWTFGDGNTSNTQNPVYLYSDTGTYSVSLVVTTQYCADTLVQDITIQTLAGGFDYTFNCQTHELTVNDTSLYSGAAPNAWTWYNGTIDTLTGNPVNILFTDTGTYSITLIVSTQAGCTDTISQNVQAFGLFADFSVSPACLYSPLVFTDETNSGMGTITSWSWDFGDGLVSDLQNPAHLYTSSGSGNYNVVLVVQNDLGCVDTVQQSVTVNPVPNASFTIIGTTYQVEKPVSFVDASTGVSSWDWDFGDGFGTATVQNPVYTYLGSGSYNVQLIVTNEYGCVDSLLQPIAIIGAEDVYPPVLPTGFTPNGDNSNDTLFVRGGPFLELDFRVYNEWGNLVYETTDPGGGWDGTRKGVAQPVGVYVYTVRAVTTEGKEYNVSGEITLIR